MQPRGVSGTEALKEEGNSHVLVQQFRLRIVSGADGNITYEATKERISIGTHPSVDVILGDRSMSRFHCEIALEEGRPILRDLGSRNGTRVDGVRVQVAFLHDGAMLTLGRTEMRFEIGDREVKLPISDRDRFGLLVGRSSAMRALFARLEQAAASDATVLLQGKTGTGKDCAAESIHKEGARKSGPFVVVDCGAIPHNLLSSELFGYERGAFTGAERARAGAIERAQGGTLFLDEIGELSAELQPMLLRVLETKQVQRIGSSHRHTVDVRIIAATNLNLRKEVNARRFRSDLYYRLAVLEILMPPLEERKEDLPLLVEAILDSLGQRGSKNAVAVLKRSFLAELSQHDWPGNVRELKNYVERYLAFPDANQSGGEGDKSALEEAPVDLRRPLREAREDALLTFERRYIEALLASCGHNVSEAARLAGMDRRHFYRLIARCGLHP